MSTAPVITQQPQSATITVGSTASFTVGASGGNLTYQWESAPSGSSTFTAISGATSSSYTTPAEGLGASGTQYECVVGNNLGSATSSVATLTVQTAASYVSGESLGTLRNNFSGWVGMSVTVGGTPLTVTALGRIAVAGNTGSHAVQIVNANGTSVAGGSVTISTSGGSAGSFVYGNLASPVTLNANTTYYIVSQETQGGDQWYDINTAIQTTNVASETTGIWSSNGTSYNAYGSPDESYGPVNFLYTPATSAPFVTGVTPGTVRNNFSGWVGGVITTGASAVQVTQLGRYAVAGNTGTHAVKLVNASTGQDVAGGAVTVNMAGAQGGTFVYSALASPITLSANTTYYLVSQEVAGGDQWYDFTTTIQTANVASEVHSVWSPDGINYNLIGPANWMYVPVNFQYSLQ